MANRKVCVITGSSSGIGAATAIMFSQRGWDVCVNYSRNADPAERVASSCREFGANVLIERADVAENADCVHLAARVKDHFGRCDALVNNAGTTKFVDMKNLDGLDAADFHKIYAVNVIGPFQMIRAFAPLLRDSPGRRRGQRFLDRLAAGRGLEHRLRRVEGRPERIDIELGPGAGSAGPG